MKPEHRTSLAYALPEWLRAPILPLLLGKELRVLMPVWLLTMVVLLLSTLGVNPEPGMAVAIAINVLGCLVLGATVFGHEFNHRTLPLLLAQPVTRPAVWRAKMGILLALVLIASLSTAGVVVMLGTRFPMNDLESLLVVAGCTVLSAVGVAPWMTLLTRSTLAGAVFAGAIPIGLWGTANLLSWAVFGGDYLSNPAASAFTWVCYLVPLIGHWVAAPFLGYRAFVRLQALDGPNADLHLPQWLTRLLPARAARSDAPRRTNLLWQLVKKELRLQQTTFLITGLFVLAVLAASVVELVRVRGELPGRFYVEPFIWLQALIIPLLAGALCCAEERQHGTIEWQLVQPLAAWRQWLVKVGVALGLTELLAVGVPLLLLLASPFAEARHDFANAWWVTSTVALLLGGLAIYFSSLCQTTVRALLWTVAVASVTLIVVATVANNFDRFSRTPLGESANDAVTGYALAGWVWLGVGAVALLALMVGCGFTHFRRVDRSVRRVLGHIGWLGLAVAVWVAGSLALLLNARFALDNAIQASQAANPPPKPAPWRLDQALLMFRNNGTLEVDVFPLLAAADRFRQAQATAGAAMPDSIALSELVDRHFLAAKDASQFDGMQTTVVLGPGPALPEAVLLRVTSPTGLKMVVFANGHMDLAARQNMDQAALALSLFLLNHPTASLFQNDRPNPLLTQAVPGVDWDDVEIQVPTTAAFQQAVRESPMTILARSKAPLANPRIRFYVLADGSVRRRDHRTREEALSGIFTDASPRPMMDIRMMMRYGLVPKSVEVSQPEGGTATAGATGGGNPLSWSPPDNGAGALRMRYSLPGSRPAAEAAAGPATIFETDTNPPVTLATDLRWAELNQIRLAGWALRAFANDGRTEPLFLADGRLNPAVTNLAPGVNWSDVAVLVSDRAALEKAVRDAPLTIIARSRSVAPSPDGHWQRFYALASGSVQGRMEDRPEAVLRGSWPESRLPKNIAIRYGIARPPNPAADAGGNDPQPPR